MLWLRLLYYLLAGGGFFLCVQLSFDRVSSSDQRSPVGREVVPARSRAQRLRGILLEQLQDPAQLSHRVWIVIHAQIAERVLLLGQHADPGGLPATTVAARFLSRLQRQDQALVQRVAAAPLEG